MKKSDMMKAQLETLKAEAKTLMDNAGATEEQINAKAGEISALKAKIALQEKLENEEKAEFDNAMKAGKAEQATAGAGAVDNSEEYEKAFCNLIMGKTLSAEQREILIQNALSSTTGEDGGFLIPVDQQVAVKALMREFKPLRQYVNVEPVSTLTGSRNIEKDATTTPFADITEGQAIGETDTPKFVNITYAIKDKGGILPIPNNLINDAVGLMAHINRWLAQKAVATENKVIVDLLATLTKAVITDVDSVKTVLNKTLDPAISESENCYIFMNQDSFDKFDKMKDLEGRPVLQPDVTNPTIMRLKGKQIVKYSNKTLATRTGTEGAEAGKKFAPVIIGNLKEAITLFDRQAISLASTNTGGDSFKFNRTDVRGIMRLDCKKVDTASAIFGEIEVTA